MESVENSYNWELVAKDSNGEKIVGYECPNEIIGDIIRLKFLAEQERRSCPTDEMRSALLEIIRKNILSEESICRLTSLHSEYIKNFLNGEIRPEETKKIVSLAEIISKFQNQ